MTKLPVLKSEELIACLRKNGFVVARQKGNHVRMKHSDGRVVISFL